MIPLTLALLATLPAADPLPDGKTIDSLHFSFNKGVPGLGPNGSLTVTADGKVSYHYISAPHTGSGGRVIDTKWEVPKAEVAALFRNLVEHGLLDLPDGRALGTHSFRVTSGRWHMTVGADPIPEKILADLRPYLEKVHADMWKEKPAAPAQKPVLTWLQYAFTEKADGAQITLTLGRGGGVSYTRRDNSAPAGKQMPVYETWYLKRDEAEKLFDALIADGLADLDDTGKGKFPSHSVQVFAGKWSTVFYPKEMPDAVMKHFRPLLEKADPAAWKK
jgi:hypothetical protein